ncbi:MAG: Hsp33 family molecular chaperone HslO [Longimicrobiales bacterium]
MQNGRNYLVRATAYGGRVRAFSIDTTDVVGDVHRLQGTEPAVTAAIGRLATGALMFGAMLKHADHSVTVRIQGDGPAGTLLASANGHGDVRGLVSNPTTNVDQVRDGKLNVSGVVGRNGRLTVARDLGMRRPYVGVVELVSGEVGEDLAHYLASSEQTPTAVGIGVFVKPSGAVEAAGGYMLQLLPGVGDSEAAEIEAMVNRLPHPTTMLRSGDSPEDILERIFPGGFELIDRRPVRFHCPCSKERVERSLMLLGADELRAILDNDAARGVTEVVCEFCAARYELDRAEIEMLIAAVEAGRRSA